LTFANDFKYTLYEIKSPSLKNGFLVAAGTDGASVLPLELLQPGQFRLLS
jgi:hypothetical protein